MTHAPSGRRGRTRLRVLLVLGSVWCLLAIGAALAPAAEAHASLVSTDPAEGDVLATAPETITLTFDEPVSVVAEATRLYAADGSEVTSEARSVDRDIEVTPGEVLDQGTFVVTYRAISTDGHPIAGSLSFSVGAPSETVVAPVESSSSLAVVAVQGAVQGLTYLTLLLAAGLAAFLALLLPDAAVLSGVRSRLVRLVKVALCTAIVGALLLVPVGTVYQLGLGLDALATKAAWVGFHSEEGLSFFLVLAGCGIVAGVLGPHRPDVVDRLVIVAAMGTALASLALVGHTRAYGPTALVVVADVLHVVAGAVWFGGLVGLAATLPVLAKRERLAAETLARFSTLAGGLLGLVWVAGLVLGWRILGSWSALVTTPYGVLLLVKTALVALVVAAAAWNRYRLLPAVSAASGHRRQLEAAGRVRTAVRLEAVGLVVVLLLTGFLVNRVPREEPTQVASTERDVLSAAVDDVRVVAHLEPGTVGPNTVVVQVQDSEGEPLEPYAAPVVSFAADGVDLGNRTTRNIDSGTYRTRVVLPRPGRWELQVSVRTSEFTSPVVTLSTDVTGAGSGG